MNNAFVTGGSRGIGRYIVLRYVKEGWGVGFSYVSDKTSADETIAMAKDINPEVHIRAYQLDLKEENDIETICEQVIRDFEDITAVVNNAAVVRDAVVATMTNEDWHEVIAVNLTAPFLVSRSFLFHFLSNRKGRFIHISSLAATGHLGQANYAAAKAGLQGMSLTLAKEYGRKGITSNIVTVGFVPTDLTVNHIEEQFQEFWIQYCPAARVGTGDEISSAVCYLSSDEAGFINGEDLRISGGLTYIP